MPVLNCIVFSELCNWIFCVFILHQPTCFSSLLPSMTVNLKTGRKGRVVICCKLTATKIRDLCICNFKF